MRILEVLLAGFGAIAAGWASVLGAWSIGPSVVPALLALVAAAILAGVRRRQKVAKQIGWFAGGVMGQAVIMLLAIFLLKRVH